MTQAASREAGHGVFGTPWALWSRERAWPVRQVSNSDRVSVDAEHGEHSPAEEQPGGFAMR